MVDNLSMIRNDELTYLFKIMPFFASDYFYIAIIAIGYWARPNLSLFKDLGFLVAFSTLVTCILKNMFAFPRPDASIHLVTVKDLYGFPSGDVLVAVIFWWVLCDYLQSRLLKIFACLLIILISFSRVYLGVHSIEQVIGGIGFGFILIGIWSMFSKVKDAWYQGKTTSFWILFAMGGIICEWLHFKVAPSQLGIMAIGSLIGYGIALKCMDRNAQARILNVKLVLAMMISLVSLIIIAKYFPVLYVYGIGSQINIMLKYCILVVAVYNFSYVIGLFVNQQDKIYTDITKV